jgi:hypothetical protein
MTESQLIELSASTLQTHLFAALQTKILGYCGLENLQK